jgi:hypothetical protein
MPKPTSKAPPEKVKLYEKLVATTPGVERKGATMPYTSVNGHMFSVLMPDGHLSLRLPANERESFVKKYKTNISVMYGMQMVEYVDVPDALLAKTKELQKFFAASYAYTSSLKPKPTSKKKTGKK